MDSNKLPDLLSGLVIFIASSVGLYFLNQQPDLSFESYGPQFFPKLILWILIILSAAISFSSFYLIKKQKNQNNDLDSVDENTNTNNPWLSILLFVIIVIVYSYLFINIGFIVSTMALMFILQMMYGNPNKKKALIFSIIIPIFLYLIFNGLFNIPLKTVFS